MTIPKIAQEALSDYEGELVLVIGKEGKDIPLDEALGYAATMFLRGNSNEPYHSGLFPRDSTHGPVSGSRRFNWESGALGPEDGD